MIRRHSHPGELGRAVESLKRKGLAYDLVTIQPSSLLTGYYYQLTIVVSKTIQYYGEDGKALRVKPGEEKS